MGVGREEGVVKEDREGGVRMMVDKTASIARAGLMLSMYIKN